MAANLEDLGKIIAEKITPKVGEYGLSIPEFYIENISLPEEVEKAMDKRSSIGVVGDLNKYMQFNAAEAMNQPGGAMGAAMGTGLGAGIGFNMAAQAAGPWGAAQPPAAPAAAAPPPPPPPPPAGKQWHLAENGATQGPFGDADLRRLAMEGRFTRATMVWSQGQDGWKMAAETELAALLDSLPPPPPKP
jgi:membrane protease subunit (stomatin/prohibitin family)